jgi:para-nitrobenzyl esterase
VFWQGFISAAGVAVYLGIPYAEPPIGQLRWAAPQPPPPWSGVKNTTAFAAPCVQTDGSGAEDCLYANVYVPPGLPKPAPVMVYIHGGGFVIGDAGPSVRCYRLLHCYY